MDPERLHQVNKQQVEEIQNNGKGLSDWELNFIMSIKRQLEEGRNLSIKQMEILERIYEEKTP